MIYALVGPPASGKSTQAEMLQQATGMRFVSIGRMLREQAEHDPEYAEHLAKGDLFPVRIIHDLFVKLHSESPDNLIIDGALRRESQVDKLVALWGKEHIAIILFDASDETLKNRAAARVESRTDTDAETTARRIAIYRSTLPAILNRVREYAIPIIAINAEPSIDAIHHEIMTKLQPYALPTKN
jgi:adenylate kinase family enzyme